MPGEPCTSMVRHRYLVDRDHDPPCGRPHLPPGLGPIIGVHAGLFVGGAISLSLDPPAQGWAVLVSVVAYVAALLWVCRATGRADLLALALFLSFVSVFQVLPDWVLADVLGTLRFPDTGGPRADDVIPLAMAAMWVAPLFAAVALSGGRPGRAALLSGLIFLGAELLAPTLGLWEPPGTRTVCWVWRSTWCLRRPRWAGPRRPRSPWSGTAPCRPASAPRSRCRRSTSAPWC